MWSCAPVGSFEQRHGYAAQTDHVRAPPARPAGLSRLRDRRGGHRDHFGRRSVRRNSDAPEGTRVPGFAPSRPPHRRPHPARDARALMGKSLTPNCRRDTTAGHGRLRCHRDRRRPRRLRGRGGERAARRAHAAADPQARDHRRDVLQPRDRRSRSRPSGPRDRCSGRPHGARHRSGRDPVPRAQPQ